MVPCYVWKTVANRLRAAVARLKLHAEIRDQMEVDVRLNRKLLVWVIVHGLIIALNGCGLGGGY